MNFYVSCQLCPRNCGVNRLAGEIGSCGETDKLRLGFAGIHKGEEPPLVGFGGSGTIFVSGCNLGCSFCQNFQISQKSLTRRHGGTEEEEGGRFSLGTEVSADQFAEICVALQEKGAVNINIVTGSHAVPAIIEGLVCARKNGVKLPVLWNSSGFESLQTVEFLKDFVDIYLPDLKTLDTGIAKTFFRAPDYPVFAPAAILKMLDNVKDKPPLKEHEYSGPICGRERVIIRHLILPGYLDSTHEVLSWFAANCKDRAMLSLMTQYTPIPHRDRPMPQRYLSNEEYETVLQWLKELEIEDGFCQELVTGSDWLPDFKLPNPFSSELSVTVWHHQS